MCSAKSWDSSRPGCHLIPVVAFQDDYKHTMQRSVELEDEGFEAIKTYSGDPILGTWIKTSSQWRDIIGGKDLDEIQHECRVLFSLDAADSFDLQACATRASSGGMVQRGHVQSELLHETLSVLVSGAGSSEVNGCYLLKGRNGNAWQFELDNSVTGRTFEMFKVDEESGWWNIQERVGNSYPNPVHYGVEGDSDAILPPTSGWGSVEYSDSWLGLDPMPIIEVAANRKHCLASWESMAVDDDNTNTLNNLRVSRRKLVNVIVGCIDSELKQLHGKQSMVKRSVYDEGYEEARTTWNQRVSHLQYPDIVTFPKSPEQVSLIVQCAKRTGHYVCARNGKHSFKGDSS